MLMLMFEYNPTTKQLLLRGVFSPDTALPERIEPGNEISVIRVRLDADIGDELTLVRGATLKLEDRP